MKFCPGFQIVQFMSEGMTAQEACDVAVNRMLKQNGQWFEVAVIALDVKVSHNPLYIKIYKLMYNQFIIVVC